MKVCQQENKKRLTSYNIGYYIRKKKRKMYLERNMNYVIPTDKFLYFILILLDKIYYYAICHKKTVQYGYHGDKYGKKKKEKRK